MDAHTAYGVLQLILGVLALGSVVLGFWTGTRFNAMTDYDALPVAMLVVGIIGTIASTIALCVGAPLFVAAGLYSATFVGGFGLGLQVQERGSN